MGQETESMDMGNDIPQSNALTAIHDLVNRMPGGLGIYYLYPDGRVELGFLNDTFYALMDSTREERKAYTGFTTFDSLYPKDREKLIEELLSASRENRIGNMDIRVRDKYDRYRWLHVQASIAEKQEDRTIMYLLFTDVDAAKREHLNLIESYRAVELASEKGDIGLWIYDLETRKIAQSFQNHGSYGYPSELDNGPEEVIRMGGIHEEDVELYRGMYQRIHDGEEKSECVVRLFNRKKQKYEWTQMILTREENLEMDHPIALGFSQNVDMQKVAEIRYERENVLRKELVKDAVVYYRINLSNKMVEEFYSELADTENIELPISTDELIAIGTFSGVYEEDREMFYQMLNPEHMLDNYNHGKMTESFLYRRQLPGKGLHWLRGSISKLRRVSSEDVVAFFTAIDVDEEQSNQLISQSILGEEIENVDLLNLYTKQVRIVMRDHSEINFDRKNQKEEFLSYEEFRSYLLAHVLAEDEQEFSAFLDTSYILETLENKPIMQKIYRLHLAGNEIRWKKLRIFYLDGAKQNLIFAQRDITDLYVEEERRRMELAEITNAAFMQHVYVQLDQMHFYGNERADKLFPDHSYEKLYRAIRNLTVLEHEKMEFDEFAAPEVIHQGMEVENKLESQRFLMNWPQPDGVKKESMIEISRMFSHVQGEEIASFLCRDVTEDAAVLKEALTQAESANKAKGEFLSLISHEIRTPLNAIIGYQDMVRDEIIGNEMAMHYIEQSQIAAGHLLSVLNDVLDITSIESGRMVLEAEPFDLLKLADSLNAMFKEEAREKRIQFEIKMDSLKITKLIGDSTRVHQVLMNLISNALKFTPEQGTVQVETRQMDVHDSKVHLQFKVSDTGIGMDQEFMSRIFRPFEQESTSTDRNYGGVGLGLSISHNLVEMMGGLVQVESEPGRGTTFTVTLAFAEDKEAASAEPKFPEELHLKALVLTSEADAGKELGAMLETIGVKFDAVTTRKKALRRIQSRLEDHPYEFCLIDEDILASEGDDERSGEDIIREIKDMSSGHPIKVVVISSDDKTAVVAEQTSSADARLEQPAQAGVLFATLHKVYGAAKPVSKEESLEVDFKGMHVLLAEDNEMNMEISLDILRKAGMNITPVVNGKEALDAFVSSKPGTFDAILMDIQMPVMDGYEASRSIRDSNHPQAKTVPIIAMTANAFTSDVTASLAAGMNDHVAKPVNRRRLFQALSKLV